MNVSNNTEVRDNMYEFDEKVEAGINKEWIVDNLCPDDNIIIVSHDDEHFWLMLVDKGSHSVDVSFEDGWKNIWTKGDVII